MYVGPDVLLPVASVIAGVVGFVLMFWRRTIGTVRHLLAKLTGRSPN